MTLAAWARGLGLAGQVSHLPRPARRQTSLAAECGDAASALLRLGNASGTGPGGARVIVLYASSLAGRLPPGELDGDDVIVVLPYAPTAKAIGSATGNLIAAGAAEASIEGTDTTPAQLAARVAADLSSHAVTDRLSGAALFGNGRARLTRGAARVLLPLIAPLRHPGASAVVNGYASTPGRRRANLRLSYARAAAVAAFLEAHGIPASALEVVGHGSTGLVGPGASAANRRVVVIIEEPASDDGTAQ
jgi:outer membrane protein OmpA-like peptidoglycan-associated protein